MSTAHFGELTLRRLFVGELPETEASAVKRHADGCPTCGGALRSFEEEQRQFSSQISFERFEAGVERAARVPRGEAKPAPRREWLRPVMAMAASVLVVVTVAAVTRDSDFGGNLGGNKLKGGAAVKLTVAGKDGTQREAARIGAERLHPGDRVMVGYEAGGHRYVGVVSIDEGGIITPLFPEAGQLLPAQQSEGLAYLPESIEFTGVGMERLLVVLVDEPLTVEALITAAGESFKRGGEDLSRFEELRLSGDVSHYLFLKPAQGQ